MAKGWSWHKGGTLEQHASRSSTSAMAKSLRLREEAPEHFKGWLKELRLWFLKEKRKGEWVRACEVQR